MSGANLKNSTNVSKSVSKEGEEHAEKETLDFSGRGLKLDTENDAKLIIDAIKSAKKLDCLKLEGNTLGVEAAKGISKALAAQSSFKRALWKDLFTGRLKDEIPKALRLMCGGVIIAKARIEELDLSDNALGPYGMEGVVEFIKSPACYSLKCLRLNNNGLGIYGVKMLAQALNECLSESTKAGTPLSLTTFIVGRNRMENEGAIFLSEFFKAVGTLEVVEMPQNFIRHPGISALAEALVHNPKLRVLNLNDNTFTWRGSQAIANALPKLQQLATLNFGDCLIRSKGAEFLAKSLATGHPHLKEVYMDHGEIHLNAALLLINSLKSKTNLKVLDLNGNQFGEDGCTEVKGILTGAGKKSVLQSLSDDEGEPDSEEEESEEEEEEDEEEETEEKVGKKEEIIPQNDSMAKLDLALGQLNTTESAPCKVSDFLDAPTLARLNALGEKKTEIILKHIQETSGDEAGTIFKTYAEVVIKLCSTANEKSDKAALETIKKCVDNVLQNAFQKAAAIGQMAQFENNILVHMGLIKDEDKNFKPTWPVMKGVFMIMEHVVSQTYMPKSTIQTFKVFLNKPHPYSEQYKGEISRLNEALSKK